MNANYIYARRNLALRVARATTLALNAALMALPAVFGQADDEDDDDIYTISPFTVDGSQDVGYTSTQSQAGGRLATSLMDTPVSIQVMNGDFLADIGADDVKEATRYALNVIHDEENGENLSFNDYAVSVRGMPERGFQTRNYFQWIANSPGAFTERLDFSRGPNGVVFGSGSVAGILNVSSKRAHIGNSKQTLAVNFQIIRRIFCQIEAVFFVKIGPCGRRI